MKFEEIKSCLEWCVKNGDIEVAHGEADRYLKFIALHTGLSKEQREILVNLYDNVDKWYA